MKKEEALSELLRCSDIYKVERSCLREPFDLARLRVCRGDHRPKEVEELCLGPERKYILRPDARIVRSDAELLAAANSPGSVPAAPYWDPMLRGDEDQLCAFKALHGAVLLTWRRRRRAAAGCFS